jgi:hypothetical protein
VDLTGDRSVTRRLPAVVSHTVQLRAHMAHPIDVEELMMKRMVMVAFVSAVSTVAAAAVMGPSPAQRPGIPDRREFGLPPRPLPQTQPRTEFRTDMPMDLVRILAPKQREVRGMPPAIARADVRIVAPNARVREYVTQMPIVLDGWHEERVGPPSPVPVPPRRK